MDCPHCGKAFHDTWNETTVQGNSHVNPPSLWNVRDTICPACNGSVFELTETKIILNPGSASNRQLVNEFRVYPPNMFRKPPPVEMPPHIKDDYEEVCRVLPVSPKASAALSRRCLQVILQEQGYTQRDLAQQVEALLNDPDPTRAIPTALRVTVDVIRNFGNFSAHRITDQTTLQVIPVEPGEAEWCLDILEEMFDHYYVKPAQAAARKAALDAKLASAGRPRSK